MSTVAVQKQASKPTKSFEKFLNSYLAKPVYARTKQNKPIIKKNAPKIIVKSLSDIDAKSLKEGYQKKLSELKLKYDSLLPSDAIGRKTVQEQIDKLQSSQDKLYANLININNFDFVKEFEKSNGDINKISDPELRGYLSLIGTKIEKETFKKLIDRFKFDKVQKKDLNLIYKSLFDDNKYKLKIFNSTFTHPEMKNKQNQPVYRKLKYNEKSETMKLYLKRFCKYFDEVLAMLVNKNEPKQILATIIQKHIQLQQLKINAQDVWNKCLSYSQEAKLKYTKEEKEIINLYSSVKTILDELKEYPNLIAEYPIYSNRIREFENIKKMDLKTSDIQSFLQSLSTIIKSFEVLGLNDVIFGDFIRVANLRIKPDVRKKLRECIISQQPIEVVKQEYEIVKVKKGNEEKEKHVPKKMVLLPNQFLEDDVNVFEVVETIYDVDKYDRIGKICKSVSKPWHVALALRLIKECKLIIQEGQLAGQSQFTFIM